MSLEHLGLFQLHQMNGNKSSCFGAQSACTQGYWFKAILLGKGNLFDRKVTLGTYHNNAVSTFFYNILEMWFLTLVAMADESIHIIIA